MVAARKKAKRKRPSSGSKAVGPLVTVSRFEAAQERTDEQFRYLRAVLEDVRSQSRAITEAVLGQRQETKRLIEDLESRISGGERHFRDSSCAQPSARWRETES